MKKAKYLIITLISLFVFSLNVKAASGSLSVSSSSVYVGGTFKATVKVSKAASWNVHVTATGPVKKCLINQADASADAMNTNKTFTATCTATGEGTITVKLSGDVTSQEGANSPISGTKTVTVTKKPAAPTPTPTPSDGSSSSGKTTNNKSTNNKIKELSVDGYQLTKVDSNNYTLSVTNDVTSINVKATAEDSKAKVSGAGMHNLNVGENKIEVIVTSESGSKNKIVIKVTRKDGYYLEDLNDALNNSSLNDINITINSDSKLTSQDLQKIKSSKKTIKLNYYDKDKNLLYTWIIDGSKVNSTNDLLTTISFDSNNKKDMLKLSNYADGKFISVKQVENLPEGTKVRLYVGDKYQDNELINVYSYKNGAESLNLVFNNLKVQDGYVEFSVAGSSDYLLTMSTIPDKKEPVEIKEEVKCEKSYRKEFLIAAGAAIFLLLLLLIVALRRRRADD